MPTSPLVSKIGFFTPVYGAGVDCGYGYAAVQLITAWQRAGVPVWAFDREAPVVFNFGQPHFYERVEGKLNIGYTPWESSKVPDQWVKYMNKMDEIWATCELNALWYRDAGVEVSVRVLHHGINREHFPLRGRYLNDGPFRFLHIGEPSPRKGGATVYEVFKDTFGDSDEVELTLKGKPRFKVHGSNVRVVRDILDQSGMRNLYLDHHAMIYPTNGEGFGFIPFQAAATGMPTAVTNWSAPVDYMDYCFPIKVAKLVEPDYEPHEGLWAEPDRDNISLWMRSFVENFSFYSSMAYSRGGRLQANWSWDTIGHRALEYMTESLNRSS